MNSVWYRREFEVPYSWKDNRVLIHFGAVDYDSEVWINGVSVGRHKGGYSSFTYDITEKLRDGVNVVTVCAEDDPRTGLQPKGKQRSEHHFIHNIADYTRTTGIWQTVWLECVPNEYIESLKMIPNVKNECFHIETHLVGNVDGYTLEIKALYENKVVGTATSVVIGNSISAMVPLSEAHLWGLGGPELYDLEFTLLNNGKIIDNVQSYMGLRSVHLRDGAILINGKPVFQRLVLDQGFNPDGIYTPPSEEHMINDINISLGLGFNGARLHEKIFEPRFLYLADKMGYLVWGEHANWGLNITTPMGLKQFLPEWMEALKRDFNHPAIIGWCPFNETWDEHITSGARQDNDVLRIVYNVTKAIDTTRPVIDVSGNFHVVTDIYDIHDYDQVPVSFAAKFEPMKDGGKVFDPWENRQSYEGQPYFVSEYGGIWWSSEDNGGWGYGERPKTEEEYLYRYKGLTEALLNNPRICAFCFTQLYDVEQEVNGLYTYDRRQNLILRLLEILTFKRQLLRSNFIRGRLDTRICNYGLCLDTFLFLMKSYTSIVQPIILYYNMFNKVYIC